MFKLFRTKNVRAESIDGSLKEKLRRLLSSPKRLFGGVVVTVATAVGLAPAPAMAADNQMVDTSDATTNTQTVDYQETTSDDFTNQVAQAVAESQAITDSRSAEYVAPAAESAPVVETAAPVQEVTTPAVNEVETPVVETETPAVEAETPVAETEMPVTDTQDTVSDDLVDQVAQAVEESQAITDSRNESTEETTPVADDTPTQEVEDVQENTETNNVIDSNDSYQVFVQDGQTYVVGDVSEDQLTEIANQYGSVNVFDRNSVDEFLTPGTSVNLGDSGYTASKDESGNVVINDANGNVVTSWNSENVQENTQNEQNNQQNNDSVSDFEVDSNEYLLIKNEDGSYTIAQGGVGLTGQQLQEVIDGLKADGTIPEDAVVNSDVLPQAPTDEMINNGQTSQSATIGDYVFTTTDGKNYTVYDKDGNLVTTIGKDDYEEIQNDQLEENQNTSNNPDAEPGDKPVDHEDTPTPTPSEPTPSEPTPSEPTPSEPTPSEPTPSEPTPSEPTPSEPTPSEPTPSEPTPSEPTPSEPTPSEPTPSEPTPSEPVQETPTYSNVPRTGDASAAMAAAYGIAGAGLAAAGVVGMKRSKDEKELEESKDKEKFNDTPNNDDYEAIAEAWVNSDARKEWLANHQQVQQSNQKGKTR